MTFGLIGASLGHSFSPGYFQEKFARLQLQHTYDRFELTDIKEVTALLQRSDVSGLNVTIPYKEAILPYVDELSSTAKAIGAVNCLEPLGNGRWKGHNTDAPGFAMALKNNLGVSFENALVLGSGGAAKAVVYALELQGIPTQVVSRNPLTNQVGYAEIPPYLKPTTLVVQTTPLGTWPHVDEKPPFPYALLGKENALFDLVYNPPLSAFLAEGKRQGCQILSGLPMLKAQADLSWDIWQKAAV